MAVDSEQLRRWIEEFVAVRPHYQELARQLEKVMAARVLPRFPLAQVQARAKSVSSFALKILRKDKYVDPLREITDLCGARAVVHLLDEVEAVGRFIRNDFLVHKGHSFDTLSRLAPDQFGYRSVHFVVEIRPGKPPGIDIPKRLVGPFAEIQVRTIAQHAWSDIGHDRLYKAPYTYRTPYDVPEVWKREAARAAALLEAADQSFGVLTQGVSAYETHAFGGADDAGCREEISHLEVIAKFDPSNAGIATRRARLALVLEDWDEAIRAVESYKGPEDAALLACLGEATCRKAEKKPHKAGWKGGAGFLERAASLDGGNVEAHLRLADLLAAEQPDLALEHYRAAFDRDPSNPAALFGYVRHKMRKDRTTAFIPLLHPNLEEAIRRSRDLAAAGVDLPQAHYRISGFLRLLGPERELESLAALAMAVSRTGKAITTLEAALQAATVAAELEPSRRDIESARRFLLAALQARAPSARHRAALGALASPGTPPIRGPVVIVAGGCDPFHEATMQSYRELVDKAFADFSGTVISGGTRQGISGLVGELGERYAERLHTIGYLPATLPADDTAAVDPRYHERRKTSGKDGFSAIEPLQNWIDLMASGIAPEEVRVLGINGGDIAGLEYRFALALGARVAVVEGSGREAEHIVKEWPLAPESGLLLVPHDPATLQAFLRNRETGELPAEHIERAAQLQHQAYLAEKHHQHPDPAMRPWKELPEGLRESNRDQIRYMESVLRSAGFGLRTNSGADHKIELKNEEIDRMAEMEHGRFNLERLQEGWKKGSRDVTRNVSPSLVAWSALPPSEREWDRNNIRRWPGILETVGVEIYRLEASGKARPRRKNVRPAPAPSPTKSARRRKR